MRRVTFLIIGLGILALFLSGCTKPSVHDEPVKLALQELLASDEFTQEERDAVDSIKVHDDKCHVRLVKGFTTDADTIYAISTHIAEEFAREFKNVAMEPEYQYMVPKYHVYILLDYVTDAGTNKARPVEAYWDTARDKVELKKAGLADTSKEIH